MIEVEDDGVGIPGPRLPSAPLGGIGLRNVHERLRVLYGAAARLELTGAPGRGVRAHLEIPLDLAGEKGTV